MTIRQQLALLAHYHRGRWPLLAVLFALTLMATGLKLLNPVVMRHFIDGVMISTAWDASVGVAIVFLAVALAFQAASLIEAYLATWLASSAKNALRIDLVHHCLGMDGRTLMDHPPGALLDVINTDVEELTGALSRLGVGALSNVVLLAGALTILYALDLRLCAGFAAYSALALALTYKLHCYGTPFWREVRVATAACMQFVEERLVGSTDLRTCGAVPHTLHQSFVFLQRILREASRAGTAGAALGGVNGVALVWGQALAAGLGAVFYQRHWISLGTVYLLFNYTQLLLGGVRGLLGQALDWQKADVSLGRVQALLATKSLPAQGTPVPDGQGTAAAVSFKDVCFGYDPGCLVLQDVSFDLPAGQVLGVVGRTGSGKTTLMRLLFRLYDVSGGAVFLGGGDVRDYSLRDLRRRIAMVTQDVQLFRASVRDNLTLFDPGLDDASICRALTDLGCAHWLASLPHGLDTVLGEEGVGLSDGQAQILALARAFLREPHIVILDEASSRLDAVTEAEIQRAIAKLLEGRTGIIIAHRLETLRRVDRILILEDGRVVEYGVRKALAEDSRSRFYALTRKGADHSVEAIAGAETAPRGLDT